MITQKEEKKGYSQQKRYKSLDESYSTEEEVVNSVRRNQRKRFRIESSTEEDDDSDDGMTSNSGSEESDSEIEMVLELPRGINTVTSTAWKFQSILYLLTQPINLFEYCLILSVSSGSDTYTDDSEMETTNKLIDRPVAKAVDPIGRPIKLRISLNRDKSEYICDSTANIDCPQTIGSAPEIPIDIRKEVSPVVSPERPGLASPKTGATGLPKITAVPPEPQLPKYCSLFMSVNTPNKMPYETTLWKNGKAIKVPPPPKLPQTLDLRVIASSHTIGESFHLFEYSFVNNFLFQSKGV